MNIKKFIKENKITKDNFKVKLNMKYYSLLEKEDYEQLQLLKEVGKSFDDSYVLGGEGREAEICKAVYDAFNEELKNEQNKRFETKRLAMNELLEMGIEIKEKIDDFSIVRIMRGKTVLSSHICKWANKEHSAISVVIADKYPNSDWMVNTSNKI